MLLKRTISSVSNPIGTNLKIYSVLPGKQSYRLTNGAITSQSNLLILGGGHFLIKRDPIDATKSLLSILRPVPEFLIVSDSHGGARWEELSKQFGCSVKVSENKSTAATLFNTLVDDDRRAIFISI